MSDDVTRFRRLEAELDALFPPPDRTAPIDEPPPRVAGYAIERVLGRGGMGVVFRATHLELGRAVALKMLLAGAHASAPERTRFRREAEAVAALRHPNVVQVHDVGEADGRPFFTMEPMDGGSLAAKLGGAPLPAREAASLVATLADAVQAAHEHGIVHRDLKPANVLFDARGTPKIADFGLALRVGRESGVTLAGTRVGTPSYMAPEQALGQAAGHAADVWALGAILYEALTGRPPFRGATASETERAVIADEPVPPSRIVGRAAVPRDVETIALVCLRKAPERRFASAGALADDLRKFLRGEPIAARRTGAVERFAKWVRRRPAAAAAIAAGALLAAGAGAFAWWRVADRAAVARAVEDDLHEMGSCQQRSAWTSASAALERAKARLDGGGPAGLRDRVDRGVLDLALVSRLDAIRMDRATAFGGEGIDDRARRARADAAYAEAFREAGFGEVAGDASAAAERVAASNVRGAWIAALDDWALCARVEPERQAWVLEVARRADPDPTGWRGRARDPATWLDRDTVADLATTAAVEGESAPLLVALGERLAFAGLDAAPFLKRVQRAHLDDFWANYTLGVALGTQQRKHAEAVGFLLAAAAIRKDTAAVLTNLGAALGESGRMDEALAHLRRAVALDPELEDARSNLGIALVGSGEIEAGIEEYRAAIAIEPRAVRARVNLGKALLDCGRKDEALVVMREAADLGPEEMIALNGLGLALRANGRSAEAVETLRRAVAAAPEVAMPRHNLALAYNDLRRFDEALAAYEETVRIDPRDVEAHQQIGIILGERGRVDEAVPHFERAIEIEPGNALAWGALAQARLVQGRLFEARDAARRYAALLPKTDPRSATSARFVERTERFVALEERLPAVLAGVESPASAPESLEFAHLCRMLRRNAAATRFAAYADGASAALVAAHRYDFACAAAQAGAGRGVDAPATSADERARCRALALAWLRDDLGRGVSPAALGRWLEDPDLAPIRDAREIERLDADERAACAAFWNDVRERLGLSK